MFTVITSFSPEGYELYGRRFVETFRKFWPKEVFLICAWEGPGPIGLNGFDLLHTEPCKSFLERHRNNLEVQGKREGLRSVWSPKAKLQGYSFRHDAYKFSRKVFAIGQAARFVEGGRLFWIDADVETLQPVSTKFLEKILPVEVSLSFLQRRAMHSELGFTGYNLERIETHAFLTAYEDQYADDLFMDRQIGWDDCNQFDRLVENLKPAIFPICHTSRAQPFDNSMLALYMTHRKGRLKLPEAHMVSA